MKMPIFFSLPATALILCACNLSTSSTPTPAALGDTVVSGCAFYDKNANGSINSQDTPIGGMTFTITLSGGAGFGGITSNTDGCVSIIIPATLSETSWPILAKMEVPAGLEYVPSGENKITLDYPLSHADFLFTHP